ncbi:NnrS family protein [Azospirillum sp. sgz302134]
MPFRAFFLLASLDALLAVGPWVPTVLGWDTGGFPLWHGRALLFGTLPAVIAGFLRTALPRWSGRPLACPGGWRLLVPLWLVGRAASPWMPAAHAPFLAGLAALVTGQVLLCRDRRNGIVAALTALLAGAAFWDLGSGGGAVLDGASGRLALAALLGLVMVLGGRVAPSLTASHLGLPDKRALFKECPLFEGTAAALAVGALAGWVATPASVFTAGASLLAALTQAVRLIQWRGWRAADRPSVLVVHVAYAGIPLGFAALAAELKAAVHVWTVGAIGLMCLAVMSSMIRKHAGRAFSHSAVVTACYGVTIVAVVARVLADGAGEGRAALLAGAGSAWAGAVLLFLIAFGRVLLTGGTVPKKDAHRLVADGRSRQ